MPQTRRQEVLKNLLPIIAFTSCFILLRLWPNKSSKIQERHIWVDEPALAPKREKKGSLLIFQLVYAFLLLPVFWFLNKLFRTLAPANTKSTH